MAHRLLTRFNNWAYMSDLSVTSTLVYRTDSCRGRVASQVESASNQIGTTPTAESEICDVPGTPSLNDNDNKLPLGFCCFKPNFHCVKITTCSVVHFRDVRKSVNCILRTPTQGDSEATVDARTVESMLIHFYVDSALIKTWFCRGRFIGQLS